MEWHRWEEEEAVWKILPVHVCMFRCWMWVPLIYDIIPCSWASRARDKLHLLEGQVGNLKEQQEKLSRQLDRVSHFKLAVMWPRAGCHVTSSWLSCDLESDRDDDNDALKRRMLLTMTEFSNAPFLLVYAPPQQKWCCCMSKLAYFCLPQTYEQHTDRLCILIRQLKVPMGSTMPSQSPALAHLLPGSGDSLSSSGEWEADRDKSTEGSERKKSSRAALKRLNHMCVCQHSLDGIKREFACKSKKQMIDVSHACLCPL